MITVEDFELPVEGGRIAARWIRPNDETSAGSSNAPVIVFLHEGLGCIGMWRDFPEKVVQATGLQALIYDRFGYGNSDLFEGARFGGANAVPPAIPPDDLMRHEAHVVLPQILAHCEIQNPILFGHSDGATIALLNAGLSQPRAVISLAAHVVFDDMMVSGARKAEGQWASGVLPNFLTPFHGDKTEAVVRMWLDWWAYAKTRDWDMLADLEKITCPTLAMQGTEDAYGTALQLDEIAGRVSGPSTRIMLDGIGHQPHLEVTEVVLETVVGHLAGVE